MKTNSTTGNALIQLPTQVAGKIQSAANSSSYQHSQATSYNCVANNGNVNSVCRYDPSQSWQQNLRNFDRSKVLRKLDHSSLKRKLVEQANEMRKSGDQSAELVTSVDGWPVILWGNPMRMDVVVGKIDQERELRFIQDIEGIAGGIIIDLDGNYQRPWNGVKFNYDFKYLFDAGIYTYIEELLHIARECEAGIHTKMVGFAGSKTKPELNYRLLLSRRLHIYPGFEQDLSIEEERRRLTKFWEMGKELWGNSFYVYDLTFRDRPGVEKILKHIKSLEGVDSLPFLGYRNPRQNEKSCSDTPQEVG